MYLAASRHFDNITIWEQRRTPDSPAPTIKTVRAQYNCFIKCSDWYRYHTEFSDSVEEGTPDSVLKKFLGLATRALDDTRKHSSMFGDDLYELEFDNKKEFSKFIDSKPIDLELFESDIPPELKALSALYYKCELPHVNTTYYDIEVDYRPKKYDSDHKIKIRQQGGESFEAAVWDLQEYRSDPDMEVWDEPVKKWVAIKNSLYTYDGPIGFSSPLNPYAPLNSIAFYHTWKDEYVIFSVPPKSWTGCNIEELFDYSLFDDIESKVEIVFCKNETELLTRSVEEIQQSDLLAGWNSSRFDDPYFAKRVEIVLGKEWLQMMSFPKGKPPWFQTKEVFFQEQLFVQFDGRVTLDYMELFKKFTVEDRDSWNLETVSQDHLGERFKKLEYEGTLHHLYNNNFSKFVRYNCRDTEILRELDKKYKFIAQANAFIHQSTCHFKNIVGTVRAAEMSVNNYCWYELGMRVPDTKQLDEQGQATGAYVLVPQTGMQEWIVCFDFSSLYPTCARLLNVSPETIQGQFVSNGDAWRCFDENIDDELTFRWERDGSVETKTMTGWKSLFVANKWSISSYGTVFDQSMHGIIPALLSGWYTSRKQHQKLHSTALGDIVMISAELAGGNISKSRVDELSKLLADAQYSAVYNEMQSYILKIKLNSFYGALLNQNFRYYDKRMGQSITATGRALLRHQCRKLCEIIDGNYNIDPIVDDEDPRALRGEIASPCLLAGDTDSGYVTLKPLIGDRALSSKQIIKLADAIGDELNASLPEFCRTAFLCTPGFDTLLSSGRELVADRGFFIQKKRYVIHVIDKEGKAKDELKAMGVDMRKTTTPRPVKAFLRSTCHKMLTGASDTELDDFIMEYRDEMIDEIDLMDLGLPKGIKGIEQYTATFRDFPTTRLPGHVSASILYNDFRQAASDTESLLISSGMKIKIFKLKYDMEHAGRMFKAIAVPTDEELIPQWFKDEFVDRIDRQRHVGMLVDNMLHNMFDSIPRQVPTRQSKAYESEFSF